MYVTKIIEDSKNMDALKDKLKFKLKATSIHLLLSLLIFAVILYLILFDWYPEPFFTAQGGWQGIQLMAFVDLVLGPALTFIVFNHLKQQKEIILDLSLIAVVQITALIWGGHTVYAQRPIALVYWADAFYTVTSDDYSVQGIEDPDFSQYSQHTPPLIFSRPIVTQDELKLSNELSEKLIPAYAHTSFYENIEDNLESVFDNEVNIEEVIANNDEMRRQLEKITAGDLAAYRYVTLKAKYQNMILIIKQDGEIVGEVKAPYHS